MDRRPEASFALTSLALLVTAIACILACADIRGLHERMVDLSNPSDASLVALAVAGAIFGGGVGGGYAVFYVHGWRTRLIAPAAGMLAGVVGTFVLMAPGPIWQTMISVGVLLVAAVLLRLDAE